MYQEHRLEAVLAHQHRWDLQQVWPSNRAISTALFWLLCTWYLASGQGVLCLQLAGQVDVFLGAFLPLFSPLVQVKPKSTTSIEVGDFSTSHVLLRFEDPKKAVH